MLTRAFLETQQWVTSALTRVWSSLLNCACANPSLTLVGRRVAARAWRQLEEECLLVVLELRGGMVLLRRATRQGIDLRR